MNIPKISQGINKNYYNTQANNGVYSKMDSIAFSGLNGSVIKQESKFFKRVKDWFKPAVDFYHKGVEVIAKGTGKVLNTKTAFWIFDKSKRKKLLMNHLMTFGSMILSGFYVIRTLGNKDLDEKKKKTLAINQASVFGLSTVLCYTLDGLLNKHVTRFSNKYEAVKHTRLSKEVLEKCVKGLPTAKAVGVFDIIYRFIAPVMITPIANHLGNKMNEKKEAELAKTKQA